MKKYLKGMLLVAAAVATTTLCVSCGDDDSGANNPNPPYEEYVEKGQYYLYTPTITPNYWPDNETTIDADFEAYVQNMKDVLAKAGIVLGKDYKWADMQANADNVSALFDSFDDYEYSVKLCRNYPVILRDITLSADGIDTDQSEYGSKTVTCKIDVPEGTTCQLCLEIGVAEGKVPELAPYGQKVTSVYREALKSVFAEAVQDMFQGDYHVERDANKVHYLKYGNFKGDANALMERVKSICEAIEVPQLDADLERVCVSKDVTSPVNIQVYAYDPQSNDPKNSTLLTSVFIKASSR